MKKIAVIGAQGQLGSDLIRALRAEAQAAGKGNLTAGPIPLSHKQFELCDPGQMHAVLKDHRPEVVINTAAYHKVDDCESNPERAFMVNAVGVRDLALICREVGSVLVHISTDYVFGGGQGATGPYSEHDEALPANTYGVSKLAGEQFVRSILEGYFIIRTSGMFGDVGNRSKGGSFIHRMLELAHEGKEIRVVDDQSFAPTYSVDLARTIVSLIQEAEPGIYHVTNSGSCSWYELALRAFEYSNLSPTVRPVSTQDFGAKARRPRNSVLLQTRLKDAGIEPLRSWEDALRSYLKEPTAQVADTMRATTA